MNTRILKLATTIIAALSLATTPACDTTPPKGLAHGPMVQNVTSDSFTVIWYDHDPKATQASARAESGELFHVRAIQGDADGRRVAVFKKLNANTAYTYQLGDEKSQHKFTTRTAPRSASANIDAHKATTPPEFRILAFGDSGSGDSKQYELAKLMTGQNPALILHTGDLIYPDGERDDYPAKFYDPYAELLATAPFYPCPGNHDVRTQLAGPMFAEFELPENGPEGETPERNYWFDYGPVRIVAMDTNVFRDTLENVTTPWLDKVLSAPGPQWKICFFHHPVYSNANYGPTRKLWNTIVPVMEKHGVQLVLSGHDHLYERSFPIRNEKIVEPGQGIVYITTGAGGAELYPPKASPMAELRSVYDASHSFTIIDVTRDALKLKQINIKGTVVDEFEIPHRDTESSKSKADDAPQKKAA